MDMIMTLGAPFLLDMICFLNPEGDNTFPLIYSQNFRDIVNCCSYALKNVDSFFLNKLTFTRLTCQTIDVADPKVRFCSYFSINLYIEFIEQIYM